MPFDIHKIAIIGGGPSGLATLNEFLHTDKDGSSTITSPTVKSPLAKNPAFDEIVVFEQNDHLGGVWNYSKKTDPHFPDVKDYSSPETIRPKLSVPTLAELDKSSKDDPIVKPLAEDPRQLLWRHSGMYDHLFTNIPNQLMRFSSGLDVGVKEYESVSSNYEPFVAHPDVEKYIDNYAAAADLEKYVRYGTVVEKVFKKDDKWSVVVGQLSPGKISWYMEQFDAVVVANGRFNIPFYPEIDGLPEFVKAHPGVVLHSKSFRNCDSLKGKKVLLVGASVSAVDLLQYFIPECSEVHVSGNTKTKQDFKGKTEWTDDILSDESLKITRRVRIRRFDADKVEFQDGTIDSGYSKIIFATGYHMYYPFLDCPENEGKDLIKVTSGLDGVSNYARTKVDNLYLYTFAISDPTIVHIGIAHNPLFFLTSEANAIAVAGVWSNNRPLPSKEEQRKWADGRFVGKTSGFQVYNEKTIRDFINKLYTFSATGRYNFLPLIKDDEIKKSKLVLKDLFYKFADGALDEEKLY